MKKFFLIALTVSLSMFQLQAAPKAVKKQEKVKQEKLKQEKLKHRFHHHSSSSSSSSSDSHCPPRTSAARSLTIMLTNDDSVTDESLALYTELVNRGHNVYAFVPYQNASAGGAGIIAGAYTISLYDAINYPNYYVVAAGPDAFDPFVTAAEAASVGMSWMAGQSLPLDIVVSGPNQGENLGPLLPFSGTIGAAAYASSGLVPPPYLWTPAIAVSNSGFSDAARLALSNTFTANLVRYLDTHRHHGKLLPDGVFLNVNVPAIDNEAFLNSCGNDVTNIPITGVVLTTSGKYTSYLKGQRNFLETWPDHTINATVSNAGPLGPYIAYTNYLNEFTFTDGTVGQVAIADPFDANTPLVNAADVAGKIVLVRAGDPSCLVSTKAENVGAAGGIGMIVVGDFITSFTPFSAQIHAIPSVTVSLEDGTQIQNAILNGGTVTVTITDFAEDDLDLWNTFTANLTFLDRCDLDKPYADTNAFIDGYITITPMTLETTLGVQSELKELCCLFKTATSSGPSVCETVGVRTTNPTSVLLPTTSNPPPRNKKRTFVKKPQITKQPKDAHPKGKPGWGTGIFK